jgi:hypothetical protein
VSKDKNGKQKNGSKRDSEATRGPGGGSGGDAAFENDGAEETAAAEAAAAAEEAAAEEAAAEALRRADAAIQELQRVKALSTGGYESSSSSLAAALEARAQLAAVQGRWGSEPSAPSSSNGSGNIGSGVEEAAAAAAREQEQAAPSSFSSSSSSSSSSSQSPKPLPVNYIVAADDASGALWVVIEGSNSLASWWGWRGFTSGRPRLVSARLKLQNHRRHVKSCFQFEHAALHPGGPT